MMSGAKVPDFDAYGLLRTAHSHVSAPLRSVLTMCRWHIAPYPIFAYRGIGIIHYRSQLFTVRGNGITSLMLPIPVIYITQRSKPSPKPAWRAEP